MSTKTIAPKVECVNPNTGGSMHIDKNIYDVIASGIITTLKRSPGKTYTEMVQGVRKFLSEKNISFKRSVSWYTVTVKNDLEARGIIEVFYYNQKKLHHLC